MILLGLLDAEHTPGVFGEHWWVYFGLLQSWSVETLIGGVGVAWSLSVELAFYVLLPVYARRGAPDWCADATATRRRAWS